MFDTKVLKVNRADDVSEQIKEAAALIKNGELVAFPTETVYGLGGNALDESASARIYAAKGRPSDNPLIVHIAEKKDLEVVGKNVPEIAKKFAEKFWPGPLTIIVNKSDIVPKATTGGLDTVAVRLPSDEIARALIRESGVYIAAPSANRSGRPSTTRAEHCIEDLNGLIPMIIDGGPVHIGLESTIVDCTGEVPLILRPGFITIEDLKSVEESVEYDPAVIARKKQENIVAKAPGMKYRHYAPKGELTIVEGEALKVIETINELSAEAKLAGKKTAVLATEESKDYYKADNVISLGRRSSELEISSHLFDMLRSFDEIGAEVIFAESFYNPGIGQAIMNRLLKAAGYHLIEV